MKNLKMKYKQTKKYFSLSLSFFIPYTIYFISLFLFVLSSCNKEEPIPSYIHIDKINLTTNYSTEGSNANKILDAWIYIDDQLVGTFEMPCTVPVLFYGDHTVKILPGVKENGISETRIPYPFYFRYESGISLTAGQVTTISPTVTYSTGADFSWIEDFEGALPTVCDSGTSDTVMKITNTPSEVFEGIGSGVVNLPSGVYYGVSCNKYTLPQAGAPVFLELNYNCNTEFNVGIIGYTYNNLIDVQEISLTLRPTTGWNKVYINLSNEISAATNSVRFGIFFSMIKDPNLAKSQIYVDNIKLVN
jgi:hypothetical protein